MIWKDIRDLRLEGQGWTDTKAPFDPASPGRTHPSCWSRTAPTPIRSSSSRARRATKRAAGPSSRPIPGSSARA